MSNRNLPITDVGLPTHIVDKLQAGSITTLGELVAKTRSAAVALIGATGTTRAAAWDQTELDRVCGRYFVSFAGANGAYPTCKACKKCKTCGNPRATEPRNVVIDVAGRASHVGGRVGPTCDDCDTHHRSLFETAVAA